MNLLQKMDRNMSLSDQQDNVAQLRHQITSDETSLLSHKSALSGFAAEYFKWKKKVNNGEIKQSEDEEEYEYFEMAKFNYKDCQSKIQQITERVDTSKQELEQCEKELEASKKKEADTCAEKDETEKEKDEEDEVLSIGSNDGSRDLNDDEIDDIDDIANEFDPE